MPPFSILILFVTVTIAFTPLGTSSFQLQSSFISSGGYRKSSRFTTSLRFPIPSLLKLSSTTAENALNTDTKVNDIQNTIGDVVILLPSKDADVLPSKFGTCSPAHNPNIKNAASHLAKKIHYFSDGTVKVHILDMPTTIDLPDEKSTANNSGKNLKNNQAIIENANALIALKLSSQVDISNLAQIFEIRRNFPSNQRNYLCQFALDCNSSFPSMVGAFDVSNPSASILPWTTYASAQRLERQMTDLFSRWTSDDFTVALMLFFNLFNTNRRDEAKYLDGNNNNNYVGKDNNRGPTSIPWVEHSIDATWEKGALQNAKEFYAMLTKCGPCVTKCLADPNCKACIDALNEVDTRDQVASYRTVVSYESDLLREFSFCILQKHNVFRCKASIPTMPVVKPLSGWRGKKQLTKEDSTALLIGHLDDDDAPEGGGRTDVSWKVACGANVAYDQFPSQNQLFYPSVNGRDLWYDPVFRVETIDGRNVWAKRHYKVRHAKIPGTFLFSVLDNGVTSNEFWTIVGAADDLSWVIFHYAGAASAVGQRYLGGLLCTADGTLPPEETLEEQIWPILRSCGIEPWELFVVDNDLHSTGALEAGKAPLDFYRKDVLFEKQKQMQNKLK